jgi:adenosylcobinamide kinase/adenosylcobinamide-phosphate guanylyltransferase
MALTLLLGGARSGKSALAIRLAVGTGAQVTFVATGAPGDDEMTARIERHRAERPEGWTTVEERAALTAALARLPGDECAVVDCLTLWLANVLERPDAEILDEAARAAAAASARPGATIVVSNEVGSGIVPADPATRRYRDLLGRVNATWASAASTAYLVVAGLALPLTPLDTLGDAR